jgi:hypothetical protein
MTYSTDVVPLHIADPQADKAVPKWRAPSDGGKTTIKKATLVPDTTLAAGTANGWTVQLFNYGTAGTSVVGTITAELGAAVGGTFPGWTAGVPVDFTITDGELDSGEYVAVDYDETGTVAPLNIDVLLDVVRGPSTL